MHYAICFIFYVLYVYPGCKTVLPKIVACEGRKEVFILASIHNKDDRYNTIVSARFIDASMYRDTCHAIRIAIQFARIAILKIKKFNFFLGSQEKRGCPLIRACSLIRSNTVHVEIIQFRKN